MSAACGGEEGGEHLSSKAGPTRGHVHVAAGGPLWIPSSASIPELPCGGYLEVGQLIETAEARRRHAANGLLLRRQPSNRTRDAARLNPELI